jgi:hypothetical protein
LDYCIPDLDYRLPDLEYCLPDLDYHLPDLKYSSIREEQRLPAMEKKSIANLLCLLDTVTDHTIAYSP